MTKSPLREDMDSERETIEILSDKQLTKDILFRRKQMLKTFEKDITLCHGCGCMTYSLRKGRAHFVCAKCNHDKSLSDYLIWEIKERVGRVL